MSFSSKPCRVECRLIRAIRHRSALGNHERRPQVSGLSGDLRESRDPVNLRLLARKKAKRVFAFGLHGRGVWRAEARKCLKSLVDLDGFEPSTSSMPFKKYQSLTDVSTRNKRLSARPRGLRWTPRGCFWASGLHADSRTPHQELAPRVLSRARLQAVVVVVCLRRQQNIPL